jgi:1-acyl-sn-glycerol-3-phosphate acyltransferase
MKDIAVKEKQQGALPKRWAVIASWFLWYCRNYVAKNFHALRISKTGLPADPGEGPLVFLLNHPSWWDPITGILLSKIFTTRVPYCPIDSRGLGKYKFFSWLGFYSVEMGTTKGAIGFFKTTSYILNQPGTMVWITGQGQFSDARERPVKIRPGLGHLARKLVGGHVVPVAIEYPFWNERYPEALVRFGTPIPLGKGKDNTVEEWTGIFESALEQNMDALSLEALTRNSDLFETHIKGRAGVGGVYDFWRRLKSWVRGKPFEAEHGFTNEGPKE